MSSVEPNWTCPTCGKRTFQVIHSCSGVPAAIRGYEAGRRNA